MSTVDDPSADATGAEWWLVDTGADLESGVEAGPGVLTGVHPPTACTGRACVIHAPSEHHMRAWPPRGVRTGE